MPAITLSAFTIQVHEGEVSVGREGGDTRRLTHDELAVLLSTLQRWTMPERRRAPRIPTSDLRAEDVRALDVAFLQPDLQAISTLDISLSGLRAIAYGHDLSPGDQVWLRLRFEEEETVVGARVMRRVGREVALRFLLPSQRTPAPLTRICTTLERRWLKHRIDRMATEVDDVA